MKFRRKTDLPQTRRLWLLTFFGYGTLILAFGIIALIIFWEFYPYKTVKIKNVTVLNTEVQQGSTLSIKLDYDRYTDIDSIIIRQFKNGIVFTTPAMEATGEPGHYDRLIEVSIPGTLPPGEYTLTTNATFKVNPIRDMTVKWVTSKFTVTRDESGAYGATPSRSNLKED